MKLALIYEILNPRPFKGALIPFNYNYFLASAIFGFFRCSGYKIHDEKAFFSYSLLGKGKTKNGLFFPEFKLIFSSPLKEEVIALLEGALKQGKIILNDLEYGLKTVFALETPEIENEVVFRTISPITVFLSRNGKKIFLYPDNEAFRKTIEKDLLRDYESFSGKRGEFKIEEIEIKKRKSIEIKNFKFPAFHAEIKAIGDKETLYFALYRGLGKKRKFGFGCVEVKK